MIIGVFRFLFIEISENISALEMRFFYREPEKFLSSWPSANNLFVCWSLRDIAILRLAALVAHLQWAPARLGAGQGGRH